LRNQRTAGFLHYQKLQAVATKAVESDVYHQRLVQRVRASVTRSREVLAATASHDTRAWRTVEALSGRCCAARRSSVTSRNAWTASALTGSLSSIGAFEEELPKREFQAGNVLFLQFA
jgi:chromosome condensin MukBEF MukE localization factor